MKKQTLPSDRLMQPRRPWRIIAIVAAGLLVLGGGTAIAAVTLAPDTNVQAVAPIQLVGGEGKPTEPQMKHKLMTPHQLKSTVPPPPPPPPPPAPPVNQAPTYTYGNYPSGWTVPFIPGTNAPDTSACASSSASTVGGVAVCD